MGKGGGKSVGKALFTIGGFFLGGGFWTGLHAANWLSGAVLGASLGSSIWSATHKPKTSNTNSPNIQRFDKVQETMSSTATIPVVYGYRKITGNQTFHETNADQNTLHKHVVLCEGGIEGIESVSANDLLIPTGEQTSNTVFTIQNTMYADATVKKNGKHLYLSCNGTTKDLYLANKDDASNADTLWSWQTSVPELITYINKIGNGWEAFPTATTSKYPGDLWDISQEKQFIETVTFAGLFPPYDSFEDNGYFYEFVRSELYPSGSGHGHRTRTVFNKYKLGGAISCYQSLVNIQASTVTGGTKYTFYDSTPPSNYVDVGGYPKMAWLDMNFMVSNELNGNPSVSCFVKGRKVYDTRTGETKYSTNPAMCLRDFILSKRFGLGKWITSENIDEDSFKEVADYCDEIITYKGSSGETISCKRYELNIVIDQKQSALDWISDILGNFCGFLVCSQDKLFLRIEKPENVVYKFNDSNSSDLSVAPLALDDTPNRYSVAFIDPLNNWNSVEAIVEDFADQKNRGKIIEKSVSLEGTTSQNQALRLARFYRDYNSICFKTISFKTGQQAMHLEPGDVIEFSFHNVFKNEPFRITEIKENNDGTFEISARNYNKNIYNDYLGATIQVYKYGTKETSLTGVVPEIKKLVLNQNYFINSDGSIVSDILGDIILPTYPYIRNILIYYAIDDSEVWEYFGSTIDNIFIINNAKIHVNYRFKIIVENTSGRCSEGYVSEPYYVTGKDTPPSDVTEGRVWYNPNSTEIKLVWTPVEDKDLKCYEIKDENFETIGRTITTSFTYEILDNEAHNFYIYAVDNGGNLSQTPLTLTAQRDMSCEDISELTVEQDSNNLSQINISWNEVEDSRLSKYNIYVNGKMVHSTDGTTYSYIANSSGTYTIGVKTYSIFNVESDGVFKEITIKIEPEDITEFSVIQMDTDRSNLQFNWERVPHGVNYEIRMGEDWNSGKFIAKSSSNNVVYQIRKEGYYKFFIKAIGYNNKYSVNAKELGLQLVLTPNVIENVKVKQNPKDRSQIIVTWDIPTDYHDIVLYSVFINDEKIGTSITNSLTYTMPQSLDISLSVTATTVANFESRKNNLFTHIIIEPYDIESFNGTQNISKKTELHLYWTAPEELDISHYELRMGDSWDNSTLISSHITNTYYDVVINVERTYHFWLKAVSMAGYYSLYPAHFECTFDLNPSPVTNLVVKQDTNDKTVINITWDAVQEYDISFYEVRYGNSWDTAKKIATTINTMVSFSPDVSSGNINVIVKSVNTSGFYSNETRANLYAIYEPSDVKDFLAYQNGDYVEFKWAKVEENDIVGYEIREGYSWDSGTTIVSGVTVSQYEYKVSFEGTFKYMIKAINRSRRYSVKENSQLLRIESLSDKNIILTIDEIVDKNGTHDHTVFGGSYYTWQTLGGKFSDYSNMMFSEIGGSEVLQLDKQEDGTYYSKGVYLCKTIDVKQEITANISCKFLSTSRHFGSVNAKLEFRISKDNIMWTDWRVFTEAQYDFRYVEFRCILSTADNTITPEVNKIDIYIDVPDREEQGSLKIPIGGTTITYKKEFYIVPIVTPYALGYGVRCEITDKTKQSFKIRVLDSNNSDVGGNINWRARGY